MKIKEDNYNEERYRDYNLEGFLFLDKGQKPIVLPYDKEIGFVGIFVSDEKKKGLVLLKNFNCKIGIKLSGGKK